MHQITFLYRQFFIFLFVGLSFIASAHTPLGLPNVPIPKDNPITPEKVALGDKLFHDTRFSADQKVSCATCHDKNKGFTDNLPVSVGFNGLKGTRNAPTVINSAYMKTMFWDGREPSLEKQSLGPPVNPVEGGLHSHQAIIKVIQNDQDYIKQFKSVFAVSAKDISMDEVSKAIATFERTIISGNSAFDQFQYGNKSDALTTNQQNGLNLFRNKARCASCHTIEQTQALFTDNRFHNIGVGFKNLKGNEEKVISTYIKANTKDSEFGLDNLVLSDKNVSELGRYTVSNNITNMGEFKTPTLRNIEITAPYMHDGSLNTLKEVIDFYNNGGRVSEQDPETPFLSGGIKPLNLSDQEKSDLEAFLKALTSPQFKPKTQEKQS